MDNSLLGIALLKSISLLKVAKVKRIKTQLQQILKKMKRIRANSSRQQR